MEFDKSVLPQQVRWYVDGVQRHIVYSDRVDTTTWNNATDHGFFILLNVAIGGNWPGNPTSSTSSEGTMLVDYVRVYTRSLPTISISGTVKLQSRTDHRGSYVSASEQPCVTFTPVVTVATALDGGFAISMPSGKNYQCLQAAHSLYLSKQKYSPTGNLGVISLYGGDVNGDNAIDILDLAYIAIHYNKTDPTADINADGIVNILDLAIVASNYGKKGPLTDWQ
jgi:hypothetical protein